MKISLGKHTRVIEPGLLMIRGFIVQVVSLFTITKQDLMEAGIYLQRMHD